MSQELSCVFCSNTRKLVPWETRMYYWQMLNPVNYGILIDNVIYPKNIQKALVCTSCNDAIENDISSFILRYQLGLLK